MKLVSTLFAACIVLAVLSFCRDAQARWPWPFGPRPAPAPVVVPVAPIPAPVPAVCTPAAPQPAVAPCAPVVPACAAVMPTCAACGEKAIRRHPLAAVARLTLLPFRLLNKVRPHLLFR